MLTALKKKGYTPLQGPNSKAYAELTQGMAFSMILNDKSLYQDLIAGKESAVEKLQSVYDRLKELIDDGFIDSTVNDRYPDDNYDQAILNFLEGDVPFWICNTEKVSGMKKRESKSDAFVKKTFSYTFIYPPIGEKGAYVYKEPWFGFSVNKKAKNYDYAVEFIRFLATRKEINTIAKIKGVPSVATKHSDLAIYKNILKPKKVTLESVNEGKITSDVAANWYATINQYVSGKYATGQDALKEFVKKCSQ